MAACDSSICAVEGSGGDDQRSDVGRVVALLPVAAAMNLAQTRELVRWVLELPAEDRRLRNLALLDMPPLFDLELASACNIVCRFCPRGEMNRAAGLMSEQTFSAVQRFFPPDAVIMISGLGDALLHPQLAPWVGNLTSAGHSCCVITNGVALTPQRQDALFAAGIAQIQVSVHSLRPDTARKIVPRGARPGLVRQHLERLAASRPDSLRVRLNFVETPENEPDRAEVAALAEELGFDFFYRREHTRAGSLNGGRVEHASGCGIFAAVTFVSSDGDVLPCVNDVPGENGLGNVRELTWGEVLAWKVRVINEGRWFSMCSRCDDDYRWVLLAQGGLDEPVVVPGVSSP